MSKALLLGPAFETFNVDSFWEYISSIYSKPKPKISTKKPFQAVSVSRTKKGFYRFAVKVDPKTITKEEVTHFAKELGVDEVTLCKEIERRKIRIVESRSSKIIVDMSSARV